MKFSYSQRKDDSKNNENSDGYESKNEQGKNLKIDSSEGGNDFENHDVNKHKKKLNSQLFFTKLINIIVNSVRKSLIFNQLWISTSEFILEKSHLFVTFKAAVFRSHK